MSEEKISIGAHATDPSKCLGHHFEDGGALRGTVWCTDWPNTVSIHPPKPNLGRGQAREAVARWLSDQYDTSVHVPSGEGWEKGGIEWRDGWLEHADELLALPELAAILTAARQPPHSSR